jgi:riboflavin kinase
VLSSPTVRTYLDYLLTMTSATITTTATSNNDTSVIDKSTTTASSKEELTAIQIEEMLPIRMVSKVVRGFGRGSSDLGIPTANLDRQGLRMAGVEKSSSNSNTSNSNTSNTSNSISSEKKDASLDFEDLPCGIYWGFCRIGDDDDPAAGTGGVVYMAALSIGYNPTYGNDQKTIEPHLIAPATDPRRHVSSCGETVLQDFYDQSVRLSVVGYLRPELPFEGLEKLVVAIKNDIATAEKLGSATDDATTHQEREWVKSETLLE